MINDPSIRSAYENQVFMANTQNTLAIANYKGLYEEWKRNAPIYAACIPPVKGPDEPPKPLLKRIDAAIFEQIYIAYSAGRASDIASPSGELDISPAVSLEQYAPPVVEVAGPPKQPKNPIGVLVSDEEDDIHAPALGDVLPAGSMYEMKATGVTYQKFRKKPNPMGIASFVWVPVEG